MKAAWAWALIASGCGFEAASSTPEIDAPMIDSLDAPGTEACPWPYTVPMFLPCPMGGEDFAVLDLNEIGEYVFDTDAGTLLSPTMVAITVSSTTDGTARVIWTKRFDVDAVSTLRAVGDLPLIIVSQSEMFIDGTVDVGSRVSGSNSEGAGSDPPACDVGPPAPGMQCEHGGSGGGGGGFGTGGAIGGPGGFTRDCPAQPAGTGVPGGAGGLAVTDGTFHGGCDGAGGAEGNGPTAGKQGDGGGALHLIARGRIAIGATGKVLAGGGGGTGGAGGRAGGGGGGSGGMIMLSALEVRLAAGGVVAANGGGGGGGSNTGNAGEGQDGLASAMVASGGAANGGGVGGSGAAGTTGATAGTGPDRGGGGGGGGVGDIVITVTSGLMLAGVVSPAP